MTREDLAIENPNMLFADGFDDALIGTTKRESTTVAHYSTAKCIEILAKEMTEEEAIEYFYFNVEGAYLGTNTPLFKEDLFEEE